MDNVKIGRSPFPGRFATWHDNKGRVWLSVPLIWFTVAVALLPVDAERVGKSLVYMAELERSGSKVEGLSGAVRRL